jgi:hypothetical protein
LIPDIEKFLLVAIFKMATTIPQKFNIVRYHQKFDMWEDNDVATLKNFYRSPFSKWPPQYCTNSTLSDFNDISYVGRLWCAHILCRVFGSHFENGRHLENAELLL